MKKTVSIALALLLLLSLPAFALAESTELAAAEHLHELGLLQGYGTDEEGNVNYGLERLPSRAEALVMLIRLLGEEEEAKACTAETPFTDIASHWAKNYIAYAYAKGYTKGTGDGTTFSPEPKAEARMYLTFVLRALGYKDGEDFEYKTAWEKTDELGVTAGEYNAENNKSFDRGDMVCVSDSALEAEYKGEDSTLLEKLAKAGAVTLPEPEEPGITVTAGADGLVIEVTNQTGLTEALNQTEKVAEIFITEDFTVSEDSGVSFEGEKLEIYADVVMTVAEGVTLTVVENGQIGVYWFSYEGDWETGTLPNGKLINNGTIILEKEGWLNGEFTENSGTVIVRDGGQCQTMPNLNTGTVTVETGGSYRTTQGQLAVNEGTIVIAQGANMVARFGSTIENRGSLTVDGLLSVGYVCFEPQGDGMDGHEEFWFRNSGTLSGSGVVRVYDVFNEDGESEHDDHMLELMREQLGETNLTVLVGVGTGV